MLCACGIHRNYRLLSHNVHVRLQFADVTGKQSVTGSDVIIANVT